MNKSVLVLNTPESCSDCKIGKDMSNCMEVCIICPIAEKVALNEEAEAIPDWCPLRVLPEKKTGENLNWAIGWNDCIDEITGGGEREKGRHTKEYTEWRKEVLERDKYTCQMCGSPNSNIVHHKIRFRDCYDNENVVHDVNNGICLCKRCHKMVHGGGNYING